MVGYNILISFLQWGLGAAGGAILLFGVFKLFQSFGEHGTGNDRTQGILMAAGGIAAIALAANVGVLIPPPPAA